MFWPTLLAWSSLTAPVLGFKIPSLPSSFPTFAPPSAWPISLPSSWTATTDAVLVPSFPTPFEWPQLTVSAPVPVKKEAPSSQEDPAWAVATIFSLAFRGIGQLGFAVLVALVVSAVAFLSQTTASIGALGVASSALLAGAPVWLKAALLYLTSEGVFYGACLSMASGMSSDRSFKEKPFTSERRQELWTRILRDPTQSPREFVESWFYADRVRRGGAWSALLGFVRNALGFPEAEAPRGSVAYSELRRADVMHWLASGLFELPLPALSTAERVELDELVNQLEDAAGAKLLDANDDTPTEGIRSMVTCVDDVRWLHRPLCYYALTQGVWAQGIAPQLLANAGFVRGRAGALEYWVAGDATADEQRLDRPEQRTRKPSDRDGTVELEARTTSVAAPDSSTAASASASVSATASAAAASASAAASAAAAAAASAAASASSAAASAFAAVTPKPKKRAILFIHGVGIGPGPYAGLLKRLAAPTTDAELDGLFSSSQPSTPVAPPAADASVSPSVDATAPATGIAQAMASSRVASEMVSAVGTAKDAVSSAVGSVRMSAQNLGEDAAAAAQKLGDEFSPDRVVIAIEVSQFCQRIDPSCPASPAAFAEQVSDILDAHDVDDAIVVGHSLGSAYANYLRRYTPERVAALTVIDPICAMMHHSTVSEAFVYKPVGPNVRIAAEEYFIRRELFTSNVIARRLRWHEAALWPADCVPSKPTLVVLSEADEIVPVNAIRDCASSWRARARGVQLLSLPGLGHGGWIVDSKAAKRIADRVRALHASSFRVPQLDQFAP